MSLSDSGPSHVAHGALFEAGRSAAIPARLFRTGNGEIAIEAEGGPPQFGSGDIVEVSERLGSVPRRLALRGGGVFETRDNDAVDALLAGRIGRASALLNRAEAFHPRLAAVAAAVLLGLWLAIQYGLPLAANAAARLTPVAVAKLIDRGVLGSVDFAILEPTMLAAGRQEAIRAGFADLASRSYLQGAGFELMFRRSGAIGPNAFALPGGTVVITDALVDLARSDEEIFGVLAHEIAHVEERHGLRQIYRVLGLSVIVSLAGGESGEIVDEVVGQAGLLLSLSYSRQFETDADRRAVALMRQTGRDPQALATMLERLLSECRGCGERSWYSTHPGVRDRIDSIRRMAGG